MSKKTIHATATAAVSPTAFAYFEEMTAEDGSYHPIEVDHPRAFHQRLNGAQYYHCGDAADGTWIYRRER